MKNIKTDIIIVVLISIILGFLSGIIGYSFVNDSGIDLSFWRQVDLTDINVSDQQVLIDRPRSVLVNQDLSLQSVEQDILPTLFNIYPWKESSNALVQAYLDSEFLGQGFSLTADGWFVTTEQAIANLNGQYGLVGYQNSSYVAQDLVKDSLTGIVFGRVEAENLPVARMGSLSQVSSGQTVAILSQRKRLNIARVESIGYDFSRSQDIIQSSDLLNKRIFLDISLDSSFEGAVVSNLKGEVVGLVVGGEVLPIDYFKSLINFVLEGKEIERSGLGIKYIDLSHVEGLIDWGNTGALVYENVPTGNPAYGLIKSGDLILSVNDIKINDRRSLSEIFLNYQSGDMLEFVILRDAKEKIVEVKLP